MNCTIGNVIKDIDPSEVDLQRNSIFPDPLEWLLSRKLVNYEDKVRLFLLLDVPKELVLPGFNYECTILIPCEWPYINHISIIEGDICSNAESLFVNKELLGVLAKEHYTSQHKFTYTQ